MKLLDESYMFKVVRKNLENKLVETYIYIYNIYFYFYSVKIMLNYIQRKNRVSTTSAT